MSNDPRFERPSTLERFYLKGEKEGVTFEIIEMQVGEVDVYLNADFGRGKTLDFLYEELKGYYVGTIHKLSK